MVAVPPSATRDRARKVAWFAFGDLACPTRAVGPNPPRDPLPVSKVAVAVYSVSHSRYLLPLGAYFWRTLMNLTKTLVTATAAAAIVGAFGLVSAQTTTPADPASPSSPAMQNRDAGQPGMNQGTTGSGAMNPNAAPAPSSTTSPSAPSMPAATVDTPAFQTERPAQADRN